MSLKIAGVYDIECADWDRFLVGAFVGRDGARFMSWSEDDFFENLCRQTGVWYAHAGGRYDCLWFLDMCCRRGVPWSAMMRGAGVLSVKVGTLELRDSFALIPMSLAKAAGLSGRKWKIGLGLTCECGESCGGYCALSRPLDRAEKESVETYLWADCDVLDSTLDALETVCERQSIELALTVGGTAWKTAKKWSSLPASTHDLSRYRAIREGYYGGRVEVYRAESPIGHRYDIHSSYPAALTRVSLPCGEPRMVSAMGAHKAFRDGAEGVFTGKLTIPECNVPPLAVRVTERLIYPHGPIEGTWTANEIRYAVECGARIDALSRAYVWPDAQPLLADFANRVWRMRADAAEAGETTWAAWYKWLANSCTGKLAQRPEHSTLKYLPGECPEVDEHEDIVCVTNHGAYVSKTRVSVDACAHVQWSAYLTADARIELHRQLSGAPRPIYCDTDSVYAMDEITRRIGPELGEWGYEGGIRDWRCPAPKVYSYRDPVSGKVSVKGKGMPGLDSAGFDALISGQSWNASKGVEGLKTQIRGGASRLFERRALTRSLHPVKGWIGGRELGAAGVTLPTTVARYAAAENVRRDTRRDAGKRTRAKKRASAA